MDAEQAQRVEASAAVLLHRVAQYCRGRQLTTVTIHTVQSLVDAHVTHAHQYGIEGFPPMVVLALPSVGYVQVVRRDLDPSDIDALIRGLHKDHPRVSPLELAQCVRRGFPDYDPRKRAA